MAVTQATQLQEDILHKLAELGGKAVADDEITFGKTFQLPELYKDNPRGAVDFLIKWIDQNEEPMRFSREFPYKPWDGAVAVMRAFRRIFGTSVVQKSSFFEPAGFRNVPISPTEELRVPFGKIAIPIFRGVLRVQGTEDADGYLTFVMHIDAPKKFQYEIQGIFNLIADELEKNSIYRGKAIDGDDMPNFLDLSLVNMDTIVYSQLTLRQIEANLWTPILYPEVCKSRGLDPKRAVLLQGPYGTGKTLGAMATAVNCQKVDRTFIMCNPKDNNAFECLKTAALYQPSCLFIEDIDKLASTSDRDAMARLLDEFDGLKAKGRDIVIVLTTNRVGEIHKGMLRPGRMDAVIEISNLDLEGVIKLIHLQFKDEQLASDLDMEQIHEAMEGFTPAFIKEVCQKVKLYSIARVAEGESEAYTTEDFLSAIGEMRSHYDLHTGANELKAVPTIDTAVADTVYKTVQGALDRSTLTEPGADDVPQLELHTPRKA